MVTHWFQCHRGFCYTKDEHVIGDHHASHINLDHQIIPSSSDQNRRKSGFDFCTDSGGHIMDCEILEILGDQDYEGIMLKDGGNSKTNGMSLADLIRKYNKAIASASNDDDKGEEILLDSDSSQSTKRTSWADEPIRGKCFDHEKQESYDCNLIKNFHDGLVLIEDLREQEGCTSSQPKNTFSIASRKDGPHSHHADAETPSVIYGSDIDPVEDLRTNIQLNLEGM